MSSVEIAFVSFSKMSFRVFNRVLSGDKNRLIWRKILLIVVQLIKAESGDQAVGRVAGDDVEFARLQSPDT